MSLSLIKKVKFIKILPKRTNRNKLRLFLSDQGFASDEMFIIKNPSYYLLFYRFLSSYFRSRNLNKCIHKKSHLLDLKHLTKSSW